MDSSSIIKWVVATDGSKSSNIALEIVK